MRRSLLFLIGTVVVGTLLVVFGQRALSWLREQLAQPLPISTEPISIDGTYTDVIFLHHSTGRNLIQQGNVRALFTQAGYRFWDHDYNPIGLTRPDGASAKASYDIPGANGGNTDPDGLAVLFAQPVHSPPDNAFSRLLQHEVIIVKSCFPNSAIQSDAALDQLKTYYRGMRDAIDQHSDRVFVILTSPPLHPKATNSQEASRARTIAQWLTSDEFLKGHPNLFVFDFFDRLADPATNMLRAEYQADPNGDDSHPNARANQAIGPPFVEFVDRTVRAYRAAR